MKIKKIDLHSLRNDEHFQFQSKFRDLIVQNKPPESPQGGLKPPLGELGRGWATIINHFKITDMRTKVLFIGLAALFFTTAGL